MVGSSFRSTVALVLLSLSRAVVSDCAADSGGQLHEDVDLIQGNNVQIVHAANAKSVTGAKPLKDLAIIASTPMQYEKQLKSYGKKCGGPWLAYGWDSVKSKLNRQPSANDPNDVQAYWKKRWKQSKESTRGFGQDAGKLLQAYCRERWETPKRRETIGRILGTLRVAQKLYQNEPAPSGRRPKVYLVYLFGGLRPQCEHLYSGFLLQQALEELKSLQIDGHSSDILTAASLDITNLKGTADFEIRQFADFANFQAWWETQNPTVAPGADGKCPV